MRKCIKRRDCRLHLFLPHSTFATFHICHIPHFRLHYHNTQHMMHQTTHTQKHPIHANNITPPRTINANISYFVVLAKYRCDMCVSYLYCVPFFGVWASIRPPLRICAYMTTLSFLKFYIFFFLIFFIFIFLYLVYFIVY